MTDQKVQNAWEFLRSLHEICHFQTREGRDGKMCGRASNSELKRWLQSQSVECNREKLAWDEPMNFEIVRFVLFPKKGRITLF